MQKKKQQKRKIKITTFLLMSIFTFFFFGINRSFASDLPLGQDVSSYAFITNSTSSPFICNDDGKDYIAVKLSDVSSWSSASKRVYTSSSTYQAFGTQNNYVCYRVSDLVSPINYLIFSAYPSADSPSWTNINAKYVVVTNSGIIIDDSSTRIISLTPEDKAIFPSASSSAMTFTLDYYISPDQFDFWNNYNINVYLHNIDQNVLFASSLSPSDIVLINEDISTAGYGSFSTTTVVLAEGNYRIVAKLRENMFNITTIDEESHQFIVGSSTFIGNISQNTYTAINGYYASSSATSTDSLASACGFFSDSSSVKNCLAFLFVPDGNLIHTSIQSFKDQASTHFPLGYVTDFITILSGATSSVNLPVLDITIPEGIAGAGANIRLDLADVSWIFTATSTIGTAEQKGKNLVDIVTPYWEIVCYFVFGFYVLRRILGSEIITDFAFNSFTEASSVDIIRPTTSRGRAGALNIYSSLVKAKDNSYKKKIKYYAGRLIRGRKI